MTKNGYTCKRSERLPSRRPRRGLLVLAVTLAVLSLQGTAARPVFAQDAALQVERQTVVLGGLQDSGARLTELVDDTQPTISIDDQSLLKVGYVVRVDQEAMLISGLSDSPDTMTVQRGASGTEADWHAAGAKVLASFFMIDILVDDLTDRPAGTLGAGVGSDILQDSGATLAAPSPQVPGLKSDNRFQDSGATVTGYINDPPPGPRPISEVEISDVSLLGEGSVVKVDDELMLVLELADNEDPEPDTMTVERGREGTTIVDHNADTPILEDFIDVLITDQDVLSVGSIVKVDSEEMSLVGLQEGSPDIMTVVRPSDPGGRRAHSPSQGKVIYEDFVDILISDQSLLRVESVVRVDDEQMYVLDLTEGGGNDIMTVARAFGGTDPAAHAVGAQVYDVGGLGAYGFALEFDPITLRLVTVANGTFLGGTGRPVSCSAFEGPFVESGAVLEESVDENATEIPISNQSVLRVAQPVRVGTEVMTIRGLREGSPDEMSVFRGLTPSPHGQYDPVFAKGGTGVDSARYDCTSQGDSTMPGNKGSGLLARVTLAAIHWPADATPLTLADTLFLDIAGNTLPHGTAGGSVMVTGCPDADLNGAVNILDLEQVIRAMIGQVEPGPQHDVDNNGFVNILDVQLAALVAFFSDSTVYCSE